MGNTMNLTQICCKAHSTQGKQINQSLLQIMRDEIYFNSCSWHSEQALKLFQPRSFLLHFLGVESYDKSTEEHWQRVDLTKLTHGKLERKHKAVLNLEFKYLVRKGVPLNKVKTVILDIYKKTYDNNEGDYQITLKQFFNGKIPKSFKNVPVFDDVGYHESIKLRFLNERGQEALSRVLWCLRLKFKTLVYNPIVAKVATLMLVFLSQGQTFSVIEYMVSNSIQILKNKQQAQYLRWFFTMTQDQFRQLGSAFIENVSKLSKTFRMLHSHFKSINFDTAEFFEYLVNNLFIGYLPFRIIFQVWLIFLNEGVKVFFRITYALLHIHSAELMTNSAASTVRQQIRKLSICMDEEAGQKLIAKGFLLRLNQLDEALNFYESTRKPSCKKMRSFYYPLMKNESQVIVSWDLETIWDWLPQNFKILNPVLIWDSNMHGRNLPALIRKADEFKGYSCLLLIKTTQDAVIGAFCTEMVRRHSESYIGTNQAFLFRIRPDPEAYFPTNLNESFMRCEEVELSFGFGGEGPGLTVDRTLSRGSSSKSQTYSNDLLHSPDSDSPSKFDIAALELYYLK